MILDRQALIDIYNRHNEELYRYAYRLLGDNRLADDCVSETFRRFLESMISDGKDIANIRAYLYRIAHNCVADYYKTQGNSTTPLDEELSVDTSLEPGSMMENRTTLDKVRRAIIDLSPNHRTVIELRFLEQWSHEDISDMLGKSVEATRSLQYRALRKLRTMLLDEDLIK